MKEKKVYFLVCTVLFAYLFTTLTFPQLFSGRWARNWQLAENSPVPGEKDGPAQRSRPLAARQQLNREVVVELLAGLEEVARSEAGGRGESPELTGEANQAIAAGDGNSSVQGDHSPGALDHWPEPEEVVLRVMEQARQVITDLYAESQVLEYSRGQLALRHPDLTSRQQVLDHLDRYFGQPLLGLMNLFMIRNTPDGNYTLVRYKGMTDLLTAPVESAEVARIERNKVVVLAQLVDGGEHWGDVQVRYTISKDRAGAWKITGVQMVNRGGINLD